ncbi:hypothetical protein GHI80_04010 [Neisseria meningitidis]|uniref:hypothetical protein n=1 Tax=Neisseria meningitidis TaxID=487 RepID=UPI0018CA57FF|nr:hypothetical protein [Neisseria meningitidis]MBG9042287.1 hypothetical protein [Neisseria meningitidis]
MKADFFILDGNHLSRFKYIFQEAIRDKILVLRILFESIDYILHLPKSDRYLNDYNKIGDYTIILSINKHSRIIFYSNQKIFSIVLPFTYFNDKKTYEFYFNSILINSGIVSYIKNFRYVIQNGNTLVLDEIMEFYTNNPEKDSDKDNAIIILSDLILLEDGYIRYDYDPEHENGNLHPLHHYDIFYQNKNTFKIGLKSAIGCKEFIELLDCTEERSFLSKL